MGQDRNLVTLGQGILKLNNVDVGFLDGTVNAIFETDPVDFKPGNKTGLVRRFTADERVRLTATMFQIDAANFRLAMGRSTAIGNSQSFPNFDPSSFVVTASNSYDVNSFGGDKTVNEVSLQFDHTMPTDSDGNAFELVLVFYECVSNFNLNIPFDKETITMYDVEFEAVIQPARSAGDQLGFIAKQVQKAG